MTFTIHGYLWHLYFVEPDDPCLFDRTDQQRVATTDPASHTIYVSNLLHGSMLRTVILHELGHAVMVTYGLLPEIHRMVPPKYWVEMEEWICNFVADYGSEIFNISFHMNQ